MVSKQDRMRRLAFAKYLIEIGNINADNVLPYSATSLLNFHDALEFLFDLILEDNNLSSNDFNFMVCFDKINDILKEKGKDPSILRASLKKLKDRRVALKHKGSFPSLQDIDEAKYTTVNLFEDFCMKYYDLKYGDIDLSALLDDSKTKDCLLNLKKCSNNREIIECLAVAFAYLLRDFESTKNIYPDDSPYKLIKERQLDSSDVDLDELKPICDYINEINENMKSLEENLKIVAFGIDYNKYARFKFFIPVNVEWVMSSDEASCIFKYKPMELNDNQIEFCKNFIIESALKLQQFDFEIPKDFALTNSMNTLITDFF